VKTELFAKSIFCGGGTRDEDEQSLPLHRAPRRPRQPKDRHLAGDPAVMPRAGLLARCFRLRSSKLAVGVWAGDAAAGRSTNSVSGVPVAGLGRFVGKPYTKFGSPGLG
jgi:hypothetical protein